MFAEDRFILRSFCRPLVAGALLLACAATPVLAANADAGAAKPPANATAQHPQIDPVEVRIHDLHSKLQITDAQSGQWEAVARVMRGNAKDIEALVRDKRQNEASMTAVDDLKAYQAISEAHAKAAAKLTDAFGVLYLTMSDDQKKIADGVFRQYKEHAASAHK
jgi:hypothetical protein